MKKNNKLVKVLLASSLLLPGIAPLASQTINAAPATSVQAENVEYRVMTEEVVRFRTEENAKPVALVSAGDKVEFVREVNKKWFEVKVNGETGFILRGNLTSEENYNDDSKEIHDVKVKQEASAEKTYTVAVTTALRTADEERYRPLEILDRETSVEYLGTTVENNWFKVKAGNTTGYVKREDVTKNSNIENGQEADLSYSTFVEEADPALNVLKATLTTALRTRPGTQYSVIDEVKRDAQVTYVGTVKGLDNWFLVEADGVKGYVDRGHVTKVDEVVEEDLAVESVSAIDATTLEVTLSDDSVHEVTEFEPTPLRPNVPTEVTFEIDGEEYTATVTFEKKAVVETLEEKVAAAQKEYDEALADKKSAQKDLEDAKRDLAVAKIDGDKDEIAAAEKAVEAAQKAVNEADKKVQETGNGKLVPLKQELEAAKKDLKAKIGAAEWYIEDQLPAAEDIKLDDKAKVEEARERVNKVLELDPNAEIEGIEKLEAAEEKLAELENLDAARKATKKAEEEKTQDNVDAARKLVDKLPEGNDKERLTGKLDKVQEAVLARNVEVMIHKLPAEDALKISDKDDVVAARTAYDALSKDGKALVAKVYTDKLDVLEKRIIAIEEAAVIDAKSAAAVDALIEALNVGEEVTPKDIKDVRAAKKAYDDLRSDGVRKLVKEENVTKLNEAWAKVAGKVVVEDAKGLTNALANKSVKEIHFLNDVKATETLTRDGNKVEIYGHGHTLTSSAEGISLAIKNSDGTIIKDLTIEKTSEYVSGSNMIVHVYKSDNVTIENTKLINLDKEFGLGIYVEGSEDVNIVKNNITASKGVEINKASDKVTIENNELSFTRAGVNMFLDPSGEMAVNSKTDEDMNKYPDKYTILGNEYTFRK